jgi:CHAD domain-containing protein
MGVTSDGKWLSVEPVDAPLGEAARDMLALRLADVQTLLPLAAAPDADVDSVHQLRVSCRRAAAALRAFRPFVGRRGRKLSRWLKRLRRAAGPARDADVLVARLRRELDPFNPLAEQVVVKVEQIRAAARRHLISIARKASRGGLKTAVAKCLKSLTKTDDPRADRPFADFARAALSAAADELLAIDAHEATFEELHQLRIAAKRLRYSIELFHSAADPRLRTESYPAAVEMQDRLGALNDRVCSQAMFQAWLAELPPDGFAAFVAGLVVSERAAAEALRAELVAWRLPDRQAALLDWLEELED